MSEERTRFHWQSTAIVLIASLALITWFVLHSRLHTLNLKAYFADAHGLLAGAPVSVAGVRVGSITSVRVRPDLRENPAEVVLQLNTPYELEIPQDATVSVESAGILGDAFAEIDISHANGPTVHDGATLKTVPSRDITSRQPADCVSNLANHQPCSLSRNKEGEKDHSDKK